MTSIVITIIITITLDDVRLLFSVLDKNKTGAIEFDEFVMAIRGDLNARRRDLVFKVTFAGLYHDRYSLAP
jgi:Ca2+-binding EF-hand superfamily protein